MTRNAPLLEDSFPARDGTRLFERCWRPGGGPRAEVLLVHGFIEHGGRYAPTAEALARRGYAVSVMDLRGHGKSAGPRCWIRGFDEYVNDLDCFFARVVRRGEGKPVFVLGHSLGGLIALRWCIGCRREPSGLILSGPVLQVGHRLFPWLRHLARLGSILFPRLRWARMGGRNISRDAAIVAEFRDDPLVFHGRFPVRSGAEILRAGALRGPPSKRSARRCSFSTAPPIAWRPSRPARNFLSGPGRRTRRCSFIRDSITKCSTNRKKSKSWPI